LKDDQAELDAEYYISKNLVPPLDRIFTLVGANVRGWYDEMPKIQRLRSLNNVDSNLLEYEEDGTVTKRTMETYMRENSCLICSSAFVDDDETSNDDITTDDDDKEETMEKEPEGGTEESSSSQESSTSDSDSDENGPWEQQERVRVRALKGLICGECSSSVSNSIYTLQQQLATTEQRVKKIHTVCRDCSGLTSGDDVKCDSKDCPTFYARVKETNMMGSVASKVRLLTNKITYENGNGNDSLEF